MKRVTSLLACITIPLFAAACASDRITTAEALILSDDALFARVGPPGPCCYHDGRVVRTLAPPSSLPHGGRDPIYAFTGGGAQGQLAVIGVGPGDRGYHGGAWAFNSVTWNVTPYLITSDEQLSAAAAAGDVTITRIPANDFRCPIQS